MQLLDKSSKESTAITSKVWYGHDMSPPPPVENSQNRKKNPATRYCVFMQRWVFHSVRLRGELFSC